MDDKNKTEGYKMKIPFWMIPAHWGLKGYPKEVALAHYNKTGYELEHHLIAINPSLTEKEKALRTYDVTYKYSTTMTKLEYELGRLDLIDMTDVERKIKQEDIKLENDVISQYAHDKNVATIKGERWIRVLELETNEEDPKDGSFDLDWNEHFISYLAEHGYVYPTEDEAIDAWITDLCKNVALGNIKGMLSDEEFDDLGDMPNGNVTSMIKRKSIDGRSEFS